VGVGVGVDGESQSEGRTQQQRPSIVTVVEIEDASELPNPDELNDLRCEVLKDVVQTLASYLDDVQIPCPWSSEDGNTNTPTRNYKSLLSPTASDGLLASLSLMETWTQGAGPRSSSNNSNSSNNNSSSPSAGTVSLSPVSSKAARLALQLLRERLVPLLMRQGSPPRPCDGMPHHRSGDTLDLDAVHIVSGQALMDYAVSVRQYVVLLRCCRGSDLSSVVSEVIYPVLSSTTAAAPAVQGMGFAGLIHVATHGLPNDLRPYGSLVLQQVFKAIAATEPRVWMIAAPCVVALSASIGGRDPASPVHDQVMTTFLGVARRHGHEPNWRRPLLGSLDPLIQLLGIQTLKFISRLLPLLLEWSRVYDVQSRTGALRVLCTLIRMCWPRIPVHASHIAEQLILALRATESYQPRPFLSTREEDRERVARAYVETLEPGEQQVWRGLVTALALLGLTGGTEYRAEMDRRQQEAHNNHQATLEPLLYIAARELMQELQPYVTK